MLTRRALLAAVPALALAPCGPTNPPQPGRTGLFYTPDHRGDERDCERIMRAFIGRLEALART